MVEAYCLCVKRFLRDSLCMEKVTIVTGYDSFLSLFLRRSLSCSLIMADA